MDKREHIIEVATELFAVKGFEATSIRELAAKAEVNIAMVNYYFGSKDKLFEAMVVHKASFMKGKLAEIAADKSTTDIEKIDLVIESYVERLLSQPNFHRIVHQELLVNQRQNMHEHIVNIFVTNTKIVKSIIESGIKKKAFKKVDPELIMASIIGTINQVMLSKAMCSLLMEETKDFDPYHSPVLKKRLITHIKQLMHSYLLNN
jgi:AcrR family transcriptional regulator